MVNPQCILFHNSQGVDVMKFFLSLNKHLCSVWRACPFSGELLKLSCSALLCGLFCLKPVCFAIPDLLAVFAPLQLIVLALLCESKQDKIKTLWYLDSAK